MFYLILAILCSSSLSIFTRMSEKTVKNNYSLLAVNYMACLLLAIFNTGIKNFFIQEEGMFFTIVLGIINGFLYLYSLILLQKNIKNNGIILTSLFNKLGILIPVLMSILLFHEIPTILQITGIVIAIIAIIYMNYNKNELNKINFILLYMLLMAGITDSMSKIFEEFGNPVLSDQFLLYTFSSALIFCMIVVFVNKQRFTLEEIKYGLCMGIPNYLSSKFLLLALHQILAVIVYPTFSVGTIITITLAGLLLFKEKMTMIQVIAMIAIMISLVLLNL